MTYSDWSFSRASEIMIYWNFCFSEPSISIIRRWPLYRSKSVKGLPLYARFVQKHQKYNNWNGNIWIEEIAISSDGNVAMRQCGDLAIWRCGTVAMWQGGNVAIWQWLTEFSLASLKKLSSESNNGGWEDCSPLGPRLCVAKGVFFVMSSGFICQNWIRYPNEPTLDGKEWSCVIGMFVIIMSAEIFTGKGFVSWWIFMIFMFKDR